MRMQTQPHGISDHQCDVNSCNGTRIILPSYHYAILDMALTHSTHHDSSYPQQITHGIVLALPDLQMLMKPGWIYKLLYMVYGLRYWGCQRNSVSSRAFGTYVDITRLLTSSKIWGEIFQDVCFINRWYIFPHQRSLSNSRGCTGKYMKPSVVRRTWYEIRLRT